jgi:hypothetical protein
VVLRGNEEVVADDVQGIGKEIEVKGDNKNMFNVLSRSKQVSKGSVLMLAEDV